MRALINSYKQFCRRSALGCRVLFGHLCGSEKRLLKAAAIILGEMAIPGNIKALAHGRVLLQIGIDHGAMRACIPVEHKQQDPDVPADLVEKADANLNSEPMAAAWKSRD